MEGSKKICRAPPKMLRDCRPCGPVVVNTFPSRDILIGNPGQCGELAAVCDDLFLYDCCSNTWVNINKDILAGDNINIVETDTTITISAVVGEEGINVVSCGPEEADGNLVQSVDPVTSVITLRELRALPGGGITVDRDVDDCGINLSLNLGAEGLNVVCCDATLDPVAGVTQSECLVQDVSDATITLKPIMNGRYTELVPQGVDECGISIASTVDIVNCGPPSAIDLVADKPDPLDPTYRIKGLVAGDGITITEPGECIVEISVTPAPLQFVRVLYTNSGIIPADPGLIVVSGADPIVIPLNAISPTVSATAGGGGGGASPDLQTTTAGGGGGASGNQLVRLEILPGTSMIGATLGAGGSPGIGDTGGIGNPGTGGGPTSFSLFIPDSASPIVNIELTGGLFGGGSTDLIPGLGGAKRTGFPNETIDSHPDAVLGAGGGDGGGAATAAVRGGRISLIHEGGSGGGVENGGGGGASSISHGLDGGTTNSSGQGFPRAGATLMADIGFGAGGGGGAAGRNGGGGGPGAILFEYWIPA